MIFGKYQGEVNLATLRKRAPKWKWEAVRDGFGWIYKGTDEAGRTATVRRYAAMFDAECQRPGEWRVLIDGASFPLGAVFE